MILRKIIILGFLGVISHFILGQHDPIFTHQTLSRITVNPAYSNFQDDFSVKLLHRSQWVGFDDAPSTQLLSVHSPIFDGHADVGFSFVNDRFHPVNSTAFFGDGAYKIELSNNRGEISLGMKAGFTLSSVSLTQLDKVEDSDPVFSTDLKARFLPNFGFGFLYKTDRFYLGVSTPRLIRNKFVKGTNLLSAREQFHFYGITGSQHPVSENVVLGQALSMRLTSGIPVQFQAEGFMTIKDHYKVSFMLRTGDAVGVMFDYKVAKLVWLGYSYDWSFNNRTFLFNSGSHEIAVRYDLVRKPEDDIDTRY